MAQYGQHVPYNGQYSHQYQYQSQQPMQTQYYAQPQGQSSYGQTTQQPASQQYSQPYQYSQAPQYNPQYPQQYSQQYSSQYSQQPQHYPQQYQQHPQQYSQQPNYGQGYNYGQGQTQHSSYQAQYPSVNTNPYSNQGYPHTCHNCGHTGHLPSACPKAQRGSPTGGYPKSNPFPHHQPQRDSTHAPNTNLPRSSSFTQQSPHYPHDPQVQSPSQNPPQTPYITTNPQWQGSTENRSLHNQHHQPYWQNHQTAPNVSHSPHNDQGYHHITNSPATPSVASHSNTPQVWSSDAPPAYESIDHRPHESAIHQSTESDQNPLTDNMTLNTEPFNPDPDPEDLEDDLSKLDIPDVPTLFPQYGDGPPKLVTQVLPSNFIVADALYPLAVPVPGSDGNCHSRFFQYKSEEDSLRDFRASPLWRDRLEDTIFCTIEDDNSVMKLDECINKVVERRKPRPEEKSEQTRRHSQTMPARSAEAIEMADALAKVEKALADAKAKEAEMLANRRKIKAQQARQNSKADTEAQPSVSPINEKQAQSTETHKYRSDSGRNGRHHLPDARRFSHHSEHRSQMTGRAPVERRANGLGSHPRGFQEPNEGKSTHGKQHTHTNNGSHRARQQPAEIISPTNTEGGDLDLKRSRSFDRKNSSSNSIDRGPPLNGGETNYGRKRNYESRAESSSSEDDSSPRRQENDVTPKHKKRQPKVAAAYSRRW